MTPHIFDDLKRDEGCKLEAYKDVVGVWTVGVGHAHVAPGTVWTQDQCDQQLNIDVASAVADLDRNIPWWRTLNDARQDVVLNMCFNLGWPSLSGFHNTLEAMRTGDYARAALGMLASRWRQQVGARALRLAQQMKTGERA